MNAYQVMIAGKQVALIQYSVSEWCLLTYKENGDSGRIDRFDTLLEAKEEATKLGRVKFVTVDHWAKPREVLDAEVKP